MAGIDLRIVFGADIKESDFERINSHLSKIQDQAKRLSDTLNKAGADSASGMGKIVDSLSNMGKTIEAAKNIDSLTKSIDTLARTKDSLGGLFNMFTSLGRATNGVTSNIMSVLKSQRTADMAALGMRSKDQILNSQTGFLAAQALRAAGRFAEAAEVEADAATEGAEGVAGRQLLRQQQMGMYGRLARSGAGLGMGIAAGIVGITSGYQDVTEFAPARTTIARQQLALEPGQRAIHGDPTIQVLQKMGVGLEQRLHQDTNDQARQAVINAGTYLFNLIPAILSKAGIGSGEYKTREQVNIESLAARRGLDEATYNKAFMPGVSLKMQRWQDLSEMYAQYGQRETNAFADRLGAHGISSDRVTAMSNMAMSLGIDPIPFEDAMFTAPLELGLSQRGMSQFVRYRGRTPGALRAFNKMMGAAGVRTRAGGDAISDVYADVLEGQAGQYDAAEVTSLINTAVGGNVRNRGNIPEPEMIRGMGGFANRVQGMAGESGNMFNARLDMELINMGINNFADRRLIEMMIGKGNFSGAGQVVADLRGEKGKGDQYANVFKKDRQFVLQSMEDTSGLSKREQAIFAKQGIEAVPSWMQQQLITGKQGFKDLVDGRQFTGAPPKFGGDVLAQEDAEAKGKQDIINAVKQIESKLGHDIIYEIALGWQATAQKIQNISKEIIKQMTIYGQQPAVPHMNTTPPAPENRPKSHTPNPHPGPVKPPTGDFLVWGS